MVGKIACQQQCTLIALDHRTAVSSCSPTPAGQSVEWSFAFWRLRVDIWERRMLFFPRSICCCCCKLHAAIPVSHYFWCFVRLKPSEFLNGLSYYFSAGTWAGKTMWYITVISHMTSMLSQPFTNEGLWGWGLFFVYQISVGGGHLSSQFERHTVTSNLR